MPTFISSVWCILENTVCGVVYFFKGYFFKFDLFNYISYCEVASFYCDVDIIFVSYCVYSDLRLFKTMHSKLKHIIPKYIFIYHLPIYHRI